MLGASEALRSLPGRALQNRFALRQKSTTVAARQAVPGRGDFWSDEQRRAGVGARSALRCLTRRGCSSAANAVSVASSAARPRTEQRSAVDAGPRRGPASTAPAWAPAGYRLPRRAALRH